MAKALKMASVGPVMVTILSGQFPSEMLILAQLWRKWSKPQTLDQSGFSPGPPQQLTGTGSAVPGRQPSRAPVYRGKFLAPLQPTSGGRAGGPRASPAGPMAAGQRPGPHLPPTRSGPPRAGSLTSSRIFFTVSPFCNKDLDDRLGSLRAPAMADRGLPWLQAVPEQQSQEGQSVPGIVQSLYRPAEPWPPWQVAFQRSQAFAQGTHLLRVGGPSHLHHWQRGPDPGGDTLRPL